MNAAARLVHPGFFSRQLILSRLFNFKQTLFSMLLLSVLLSALSVIYVTYTSRMLYADYQHQLLEKNRLQMERRQLMLEQSTWMMQARVQQIAESKLGMIIPDNRSTVVLYK